MDQIHQENEQNVPQLVQAFTKKASELREDYIETLKDIAKDDLDCDAGCVDNCTNEKFVNFHEIP